jgi:hypothetical protein
MSTRGTERSLEGTQWGLEVLNGHSRGLKVLDDARSVSSLDFAVVRWQNGHSNLKKAPRVPPLAGVRACACACMSVSV